MEDKEKVTTEPAESEDMEGNNVINVKSDRGFECVLDEDSLMDVELFDDLVALENGDVTKMTKICNKLLGEEQRKQFYDFIRNDKGKVLFTTLAAELKSIFNNARGQAKN
jgi:hypothetical protein